MNSYNSILPLNCVVVRLTKVTNNVLPQTSFSHFSVSKIGWIFPNFSNYFLKILIFNTLHFLEICQFFVASFHWFVGWRHDFVKKCLFSLDEYMVSYPTCSKNLGQYLTGSNQRFVTRIGNIEKAKLIFSCLGRITGNFSDREKSTIWGTSHIKKLHQGEVIESQGVYFIIADCL